MVSNLSEAIKEVETKEKNNPIINNKLITILILVSDNPKILNVTSLQLMVFLLNSLSKSSLVIFSVKFLALHTVDSWKKPCSIP